MEHRQPPVQKRGLTAIDGAMSLIVILLMVQMWLLTTALEALLAGHRETALPAALISAVIFSACLVLFLFINKIDSEVRQR